MNNRYARQIVVPEVGASGQDRLAGASVLVVGAGGLGSAALQYLNAGGVGHLIIVDNDRVEESNLHRQPLYRMCDIGLSKVEAARNALLAVNPSTSIDVVCEALTPQNAAHLIADADIVLDAADSFAVTYILSDECRRARKTLVSASVLGLSGYVGVFCGDAPSYRAVFPDLPQRAGTCARAGVLGTAVGVIGSLQAQMTVAMILELKPTVSGRLVSVDFLTLRFGGFDFRGAPEPAAETALNFVSTAALDEADITVDLRAPDEIAAVPFAATVYAKVDQIACLEPALPRDRRIVLCCSSGVRAWRAARTLQRQGYARIALIALG